MERQWRSMASDSRKSLHHGNIPRNYCWYALDESVAVANTLPIHGNQSKCPHLLFTGKKPNVTKFRVMFSMMYAQVYDPLTTKKRRFQTYGQPIQRLRMSLPLIGMCFMTPRDHVEQIWCPLVAAMRSQKRQKFPLLGLAWRWPTAPLEWAEAPGTQGAALSGPCAQVCPCHP